MESEVRGELSRELEEIREKGRYRFLRDLEGPSGVEITIGGKRYLNFSSNDYLGLTSSRELLDILPEAGKKWGVGAGASRLICGNMGVHSELEREIARFKGTETALVFSSGYMANLGIISTLSTSGTTLFSDELNHASIVDGCRLGRARVKVYRHRDTAHLEELLRGDDSQRKIILTDGVFSMDGDIAPLPDLCCLRKKYGTFLVVDDAHATGVIGAGGGGTASYFSLTDEVDIHMGTFSKALGTYGAYICCDNLIRDYFINRCRPFIFNTGIPPLIAALTLKALELIQRDQTYVERLQENISLFVSALRGKGVDVDSETPIIPVVIGPDRETVEVSERLFEEGYYIYGVRPPTVPEGTARLRVTVSAAHRKEQVVECGELIGDLMKKGM